MFASYEHMFQTGFVTRDLDRAMPAVERELGAKDFLVIEPTVPVWADGKSDEITMHVAIAPQGKRQLETIQPLSGAIGLYTDGIDRSPRQDLQGTVETGHGSGFDGALWLCRYAALVAGTTPSSCGGAKRCSTTRPIRASRVSSGRSPDGLSLTKQGECRDFTQRSGGLPS